MDTQEKLLDKLDQTRERLLVALADLPDEALLAPQAIGRFSLADLLVQLTVWEAELVTGLMRLDQGKKPSALLAALADREGYTQQRFAENQGRDLDRIFDDLQKVRIELEGWLEQFSERDLTETKRYKWFNGRSLAQLIIAVSVENEARYLPQVETFAQKWLAEEDARQALIIPLTAVSQTTVSHNGEQDEQPD